MSMNLDKIISKQLGFALWEERQKKGLRLASLQHQTGLSQNLIDRIELGKAVPPSYVKKLLEFYKKNIKVELTD